jgi:hypothetical protein
MTDATPNPKTLDLGALLAGVELPTDTVDVYMNAAVAYAISKNRAAHKKAELLGEDGVEALEKEFDELVEAGEASRIVVHLKAVPKGVRKALIQKALDKFPAETNFMGHLVPNSERDDYHANLRWAAHIEKIVAPHANAEAHAPTIEQVESFREQAPDASVDAIENGIVALEEGAKSGFDTLAQEHGFLSQP